MAKDWVLTTIRYNRPNDPYTDRVLPLTEPLFRDYAKRHGMDFRIVDVGVGAAKLFPYIPTRGTECVYASMPWRREFLNHYDGVVYLDADAVIVDPEDDICLEVSPDKPVGMVDGLTGACQVLYSCLETREMLDLCWEERDFWGRQHWAEEGFFKQYLGYDEVYRQDVHADGGRAAHTGGGRGPHLLSVLDDSWCAHPLDTKYGSLRPARVMNPGGVHPFSRRLEMIEDYIGRAHACKAGRGGVLGPDGASV